MPKPKREQDLTQKYEFNDAGNYTFVCSGPMIVVGGWYNYCFTRQRARDQINPNSDRKHIFVYTNPKALLFFKHEEYDDEWF